MKKTTFTIAFIAALTIAFMQCVSTGSNPQDVQTANRNHLPQDALVSCTISQPDFSKWFVNGQAAVNGAVQPANSVMFPHSDNCDFYSWSEQMYLWLTSPASGMYNSNSIVLESPLFYDVSPKNASGERVLIPHEPNHIFNMSPHLLKNGPDRLPIVRAKSGQLYEVEYATGKDQKNPVAAGLQGNRVEVARIETNPDGTHRFYDKAGKQVLHPKAILRHHQNLVPILQELVAGNTHAFIDTGGNEINVELGQATGDVLMAQNGSLVYYLTLVNDVYANFLTASDDHVMSGLRFPIDSTERDSICAYAKAHHRVLPDSNALAIEIKSAWIEASTLPAGDTNNYIRVSATIPVYKKTNSIWVATSTKTVRMALAGMHVVGSVAGHSEMVWATFEHVSNSPNAAYTYLATDSSKKTIAQDNGTGWLFANTSATADTFYNKSHMSIDNPALKDDTTNRDTIFAINNFPISPSNTLRTTPWGSVTDSATNQQDLSSAASNSEIISFNNTIQSYLAGDLRMNYLLIGATWTFGGTPPNGASYGSDTTHGVAIGTSALANSTMETYFQNRSGAFTQTTCFYCHNQSNSNLPGALSHVYTAILPLDPKKK